PDEHPHRRHPEEPAALPVAPPQPEQDHRHDGQEEVDRQPTLVEPVEHGGTLLGPPGSGPGPARGGRAPPRGQGQGPAATPAAAAPPRRAGRRSGPRPPSRSGTPATTARKR